MKDCFVQTERWLRREATFPPGKAVLCDYLLSRLEEHFPELRDSEGNLISVAGTPPEHAWFMRAARELAFLCRENP